MGDSFVVSVEIVLFSIVCMFLFLFMFFYPLPFFFASLCECECVMWHACVLPPTISISHVPWTIASSFASIVYCYLQNVFKLFFNSKILIVIKITIRSCFLYCSQQTEKDNFVLNSKPYIQTQHKSLFFIFFYFFWIYMYSLIFAILFKHKLMRMYQIAQKNLEFEHY